MSKSFVSCIISKEDLKTYFNNERTSSCKELEEYIKIKENKGEKIQYGTITIFE